MKQPLFIFTAKDGNTEFAGMTKVRLKEYLLANEGKIFEIRRRENKRSLSQNRYMWVYLEVISAETGNDANELHEMLRRKLLPPKFITVLGEEIKIPRSTTELSKTEFGEYLEKICALTEVPLPDKTLAGYDDDSHY